MESIWSKTADIKYKNKKVFQDGMEADAVIIGAGMAGILTAWQLQQEGLLVVVLEAGQLAGGQTKNTTAKITVGHGLFYAGLIEEIGIDRARQYAMAAQHAVNRYKMLTKRNHIDCRFTKCPSYVYSEKDAELMEHEARAAQSLGLDAVFTTETELPFPVKGAVRYEKQAQFHPLEFINGLAGNLTVFENVKVTEVQEHRVITSAGHIRARHIVFCCHYPFINRPGYFFMRMHQERSYAVALEGAGSMEGMYIGVDKENSLSFRSFGDMMILGGYGHRTGENSLGGQYDRLVIQAEKLWPGCRVAARWSAQDCVSIDRIPYIGKYSDVTPDWYVASGFKKWGMTSSMTAAEIITELVMGREEPYMGVFSPQRFDLLSSTGKVLEEGCKSAKGLIRENFRLPKQTIDELPDSHGGIVDYDGEKAGVYKDENGNAYIVSTRCPHLGCQLEWNPEELSWDCPCHGSRFSYKGELLDNPAQEGIDNE